MGYICGTPAPITTDIPINTRGNPYRIPADPGLFGGFPISREIFGFLGIFESQ
jgi:hypothetical protein